MFKQELDQPVDEDGLTELKAEINKTIQKCAKNNSTVSNSSGLVESYKRLRSTEEIKKSLVNLLKLVENMPTGDIPGIEEEEQNK